MDDQDLLAQLASDLDGSFERLVRTHQDRLFTIALRLTGDRREAEEVAQDAFVRAYCALKGYEPDRIASLHLRAWLAQITLNLCRNRARVRHAPTEPLEADAPIEASPAWGSPEVEIDRSETTHRWAALLRGLPDRYRAAVVLRHVEGLSYGEMAEALDRPEGTIKAQVHRGLVLLREAYLAAQRSEAVEVLQ